MNTYVIPAILIGCVLPLAAGAMTIASELTSKTGVHQFANLDSAPLWSVEPVKVDTASQNYDRLPANVQIADRPAKSGKNETRIALAPKILTSPAITENVVNDAGQEWCKARYRSYNPADNTYQPFGGGGRKACVASNGTRNGSSAMKDIVDMQASM